MTETEQLAHNANVPADLAALVVLAATRLGVPLREFRRDSRPPRYVLERRRIAVAAREHGYSYPAIGRALNRDHSTIIHAVQQATRAKQ